MIPLEELLKKEKLTSNDTWSTLSLFYTQISWMTCSHWCLKSAKIRLHNLEKACCSGPSLQTSQENLLTALYLSYQRGLHNSVKLWACHGGLPETDGLQWRALTKHGPQQEEIANHSSIFVRRIPWTNQFLFTLLSVLAHCISIYIYTHMYAYVYTHKVLCIYNFR